MGKMEYVQEVFVHVDLDMQDPIVQNNVTQVYFLTVKLHHVKVLVKMVILEILLTKIVIYAQLNV